jgi:DNA polymerase III epsilon subunit family exonuclease
MIQEKGAPLWASLFEPASDSRRAPVAAWYKKSEKEWIGLSWPLPICDDVPWETRAYAAIDVETTGLNPLFERVVEVAIVHFSFDEEGALKEESRFSSLINPEIPIPLNASRIHGITDADVIQAPSFGHIINEILRLCEGRIIAGHNVIFDISFVEQEFIRCKQSFSIHECADTFGLAKLAFPGMPSYNLGKIAFSLGLESNAAHRALGDALTCMRLFAASMRTLTRRC